jgi:hypothetical protein
MLHVIPNKVDFYITNVCNLTCQNCNRFNNHNFKGWQRWSDYQADYEQWGKLVELKSITIMGGEPFLNPTLNEWITGLNQIFGIDVQVLTNGTRFEKNPALYDSLLYRSPKTKAKNHIGVSLHNMDFWPKMENDIRSFLKEPVTVYRGNQTPWNSDWHFIDRNGVIVNVYRVDSFSNASIKTNAMNNLTLHNSDANRAHDLCTFSQYKSYHFIKGKLYKCGPVALMPEFDQQNTLDISDSDRQLLNSYQPLGVDNFDTYHKEFFDNLDNPIPQCKFCPAKFEFISIAPVRKGLSIV